MKGNATSAISLGKVIDKNRRGHQASAPAQRMPNSGSGEPFLQPRFSLRASDAGEVGLVWIGVVLGGSFYGRLVTRTTLAPCTLAKTFGGRSCYC